MAQAKTTKTTAKSAAKKKVPTAPRASTRRMEPYQKSATLENVTARMTTAVIFLFMTCLTAVSYFVSEGMIIVAIRTFLSGILGYGYWVFALCLLWAAVVLFRGRRNAGLQATCILLIPVLFSALIDVFSYQSASGASMTTLVNNLFYDGQQFSCGGVISGLIVHGMVSLLSQVGSAVIIIVLTVLCLIVSVSEPSSWIHEQPEMQSAKNAPAAQPQRFRASDLIRMANPEDPLNDPIGETPLKPKQEAPTGGKRRKFVSDIPLDVSDGAPAGASGGMDKRASSGASAASSAAGAGSAAFSGASVSGAAGAASQAGRAEKPSRSKGIPVAKVVEPDDPAFAAAEDEAEELRPLRMPKPRTASRRTTADAEARSAAGAAAGRRPAGNPAAYPASSSNLSSVDDPASSADAGLRTAGSSGSRSTGASSVCSAARDNTGFRSRESSSSAARESGVSSFRESTPIVRESSASAAREISPATADVRPVSLREAQRIAGVPEEEQEASSGPMSMRKAASTKADIQKKEKITEEDIRKEAKKVAAAVHAEKPAETYSYPRTELLAPAKAEGSDSRDEILATRDRLDETLHSFGVSSDVKTITHGPTVTRYDIVLEQGVKLTKVTNLASDIALALGAANVRIAPIPDEISTVGIEVPNKIVNTVGLRELLESENFRKAKSRLTFAIGKDIAGNAIVGNISKLPHMLIAGTTGSGKSVCMNSLILSLLYKARPDEVKFIMIDPKMVELGIYNSIPHLYVPVVTDPKKAAGALQWAVVEMLKRYRLFSEAGVRDLETYNNLCRNNGEETLPQVVIVIDELADLMMAASKEVEESICRIAQMGRAAAMHLIIATQRPSADVITGLMKANIPSRIAFAVSSSLESRIILDTAGAEKLIGHGDMLYAPIGCGKPMRVQGAFVSDEEREEVINYISSNSSFEKENNSELADFMNKAAEGKNGADGSGSGSSGSGSSSEEKGLAGEYDEMLPQAAEVVLEMKQCSVSMLQRRLKLGYSRAARIVDQMEELGIVGPYEGAKPRSVPIDRDGWNEIQVHLGLAPADDYALAAQMSDDSSSTVEE